MEVVKLKLKELRKYENNPKKTSKRKLDALKYSLQKYGCVEPLVVNKRTGKILNGNVRFDILMSMYDDDFEVDVVFVDVDEKRERELIAILNGIDARWDIDKLKRFLREFDENELKKIGFTGSDIKKIIRHDDLDFESEIDDEFRIERKQYTKAIYKLVIKFDDYEKYMVVKDAIEREKERTKASNNAEAIARLLR